MSLLIERIPGYWKWTARLASAIEKQTRLPEKVRASGVGIAGLSYENSGQFQEAIRHFKLAIRLDPEQEQPYLALARIYTAEQDNIASAEILEQARKELGGSPNILLALGSALVSTEQYQAASQILAGLTQNFPSHLHA